MRGRMHDVPITLKNLKVLRPVQIVERQRCLTRFAPLAGFMMGVRSSRSLQNNSHYELPHWD